VVYGVWVFGGWCAGLWLPSVSLFIFLFLAIQFQVARCLFIVGLQQPPQHPAAVAITKKPSHKAKYI